MRPFKHIYDNVNKVQVQLHKPKRSKYIFQFLMSKANTKVYNVEPETANQECLRYNNLICEESTCIIIPRKSWIELMRAY